MKTIADRITNIKTELDELEAHVNSTLSILDCKSISLKEHSREYKEWKWREYNRYANDEYTTTYPTEEKTLEILEQFKISKNEINQTNQEAIIKNTETFNKICDFFEKLGLSKTTYASSGKGRQYRSYQVASQWIDQLRRQYPTKDEGYDDFTRWHDERETEIKSFFKKRREDERKKDMEEEQKQKKIEEESQRIEERNKAINMAVELLKAYDKIEGVDFTYENAIDKACELKIEIVKGTYTPTEEQIEQVKKIEIKDVTQYLEIL